ncbi:MAG: DUF3500 domain-containing protein [Polaromonas sp.]|nr:DUF3500 domain-containing protein [Polaromonas sp.]
MTERIAPVFVQRLRFCSAALLMVCSGAPGLAAAQTAQTVPGLAMPEPLPDSSSAAAVALAMRNAATALGAATPAADQPRLLFAFDDTLRADWHYTPRTRAGIALKDMSPAQRAAARALLEAPLSAAGLATVQDVMALEAVLRDLEAGSPLRIPGNYAMAIYGTPVANAAWGWRIEGHHLSLHFTLDRDQVVSTLPQFIGANPALVPKAVAGGPKAQTRPLGAPEDAARALLASFDAAQRAQAVLSAQTYGDIVSRNAKRASPREKGGLAYADMNADQRQALLAMVGQFAAQVKPALAATRMERVRASAPEALTFAWVGSAQKGQGHYFRVQGEKFLIEYDNSGGNHVHSIWRDFDGDWGRDVLADHYRRGRLSAPKN